MVNWTFDSACGLKFKKRLFVPLAVREQVMKEFHHSRLAVHLGGNKVYHNLRRQFWWKGMKRDVAKFVSRCLTC